MGINSLDKGHKLDMDGMDDHSDGSLRPQFHEFHCACEVHKAQLDPPVLQEKSSLRQFPGRRRECSDSRTSIIIIHSLLFVSSPSVLQFHLNIVFFLYMSLLGSQGGRGNEKSIKESLLNEQITKLREIYQDGSVASEKVLALLRKTIACKHERRNRPEEDTATLNFFMEDLSSVEDSLISLIENCEVDKEQFVSSVIFRDSEKLLTSTFFRRMMKSHEQFKQRLNLSILRLEKDIQILESSGFHIYNTVLKPNSVLSTLKKTSLDKYMVSLAEAHTVFTKMKAQMSNKLRVEKTAVKSDFKNDIQKIKEYTRIAEQICLKEKLRCMMLTEEINGINTKIATESKKTKAFQQSIKKAKHRLKSINLQTRILTYESLHRDDFKEYMQTLKESVEGHMIFTPKLYKSPCMRSKSCHTLIATQQRSKQVKQYQESPISSEITIIGGDFLEESLQS